LVELKYIINRVLRVHTSATERSSLVAVYLDVVEAFSVLRLHCQPRQPLTSSDGYHYHPSAQNGQTTGGEYQ